MKHIEPEAVCIKGVEGTVRAIDRPVAAEFLGTENEDALVAQLEVFDDGKRSRGFAEADAVSEDAPVVLLDLVDGGPGSV